MRGRRGYLMFVLQLYIYHKDKTRAGDGERLHSLFNFFIGGETIFYSWQMGNGPFKRKYQK